MTAVIALVAVGVANVSFITGAYLGWHDTAATFAVVGVVALFDAWLAEIVGEH